MNQTARPPAPTVRLRRLGHLALGIRFAFTGGRDSRARTVLTAAGVGLGVAMLLLASSFPGMKHHRDDRIHALVDTMHADPDLAASDRTLLLMDAGTRFRGAEVRGRIVQPEGPLAPLPPGLSGYPKPGEMVVSPALADLLGSAEGRLLKERLDHPVSGEIGSGGLVGPGDLSFVLGSDRLDAAHGALRIDSFGDRYPPRALEPELVLLTVVGIVVLLTPVAVFAGAATRFGGEARDRRLAALRLVGADRAMTARIAAGESLAGAVAGLAAGWLLFLAARRLAEYVTLQGLSVFAADIDPDPLLAVSVMAVVPLLAVAATLLVMRGVAAEPLGVARGSAATRRRLWWRLALPAAGALLIGQAQGRTDLMAAPELLAAVVLGMVLLLVGIAVVLPALLDLTVRHLPTGPPSWQLAVGRLRLSGGAASRTTAGVLVAVAGAIALQSLFGGIAAGHRERDPRGPAARAVAPGGTVTLEGGGERAAELAARLRAVPGTAESVGYTELWLRETAVEVGGTDLVRVGDCAALKAFAVLPSCADGDAFVVTGGLPAGGAAHRPVPGAEVTAMDDHQGVRWHLPAALPAVEARPGPGGRLLDGIVLATAAALPDGVRAGRPAQVELTLDGGVPDARERVRNALAAVDPAARVAFPDETVDEADRGFDGIRRALTAAATATVLLISLSMLVGLLEQLRERRRTLACLAAFGTPRRTLAWSLLWQSALPTAVGLLLAVAVGTGLGRTLLALAGLPAAIDRTGVITLAGTAAAAVLGVTVLTLPALRRGTRPAALRYE
ncbi:FtsX-like permease family protein [Kitasatospora sp. NPDC049258]|uniref:FtsX-like permease family protein n=1 Tax=Kitasatospora sp. NPDC049258 TaxID=3155394 RepID=UPI003414E3D4